MALLSKSDLLSRYNSKQARLISEGGERSFSSEELRKSAIAFDARLKYDVFLSHSFDDARIVKIVKEMLEERGHTVYVDWLEDKQLSREEVNEKTAQILRQRMNSCSSLIYLTSPSAGRSLWMPWELGYMDSRTGNIVIAPIVEDNGDYAGREYLSLYPYLDLTSDHFYVQRALLEWVSFEEWLKGERPRRRP